MKTFKILSLSLTVFFLLTSIGCIRNNEIIRGNGTVTEEIRSVTSFSALNVAGSFRILYSIADTFSLQVMAESNLLPIIKTTVSGNRLEIKIDRGFTVLESQPMIVRITAPNLSDIALSGSSNFVCNDTIEINNFKADLSGSCTLETGVIANNVNANISGSGTVTLTSGTSQSSKYNISGSAKIDAREHVTQNAVVDIAGSGIVWLQVTNNLNVNISGSAEVNYLGDPTITSSISGSGRIRKL